MKKKTAFNWSNKFRKTKFMELFYVNSMMPFVMFFFSLDLMIVSFSFYFLFGYNLSHIVFHKEVEIYIPNLISFLHMYIIQMCNFHLYFIFVYKKRKIVFKFLNVFFFVCITDYGGCLKKIRRRVWV